MIVGVVRLPGASLRRRCSSVPLRLPLGALQHLVQHVEVPAPLLIRVRIRLRQRRPDPQVPVADDHPRTAKPRCPTSRISPFQLSVDSRYALRSAINTLRPSPSPPIATSSAALSFSSPALTYTPSTHRYVHQIQLRQAALLPCGRLGVPAFLHPCHRARRQRRALAEQPAQRQLEVAQRQPVQVQHRQHVVDLRRASREQRQQRALEMSLQPPRYPWPTHRHVSPPAWSAEAAYRSRAKRKEQTERDNHWMLDYILGYIVAGARWIPSGRGVDDRATPQQEDRMNVQKWTSEGTRNASRRITTRSAEPVTYRLVLRIPIDESRLRFMSSADQGSAMIEKGD